VRIANVLAGSDNARYPGLQVPAAVRAADVEVEIVETGVYLDDRGPAAHALLSVGHVAAALRAERDGFDAAFINSTTDYALAEIRSIVGIPVTGCGEAGIRTAASLGRRFAIVQIWPAWSRPGDEDLLSRVGLADRCCAIRNVAEDGEEDAIHEAMIAGQPARRDEMLSRVLTAITAAVRDDGADVIVLGCTCMSASAAELARAVDVPVVDPMIAGYLAAEQLARSGLSAAATEDRALLAPMFETIAGALEASGGGTGNAVESCSVCAATHELASA
jgi:allantoin racemase